MTAQDTDCSAASQENILPPPPILAAVELLRQGAAEGYEAEQRERSKYLLHALDLAGVASTTSLQA
jgi:hypothetical protein